MARSRVPQVPGLIFLALRLGGLALSIASLYYLVYLATHWPKRHTFYWAIFSVSTATMLQLRGYLTSQASTAIVVDLVEVCCLLDASFTIKRPDEAWLIFGNIISMILGGIGIWQMVWSDWGLSDAPPDYPRPWQDTMYLALPLASTVPYVPHPSLV
jgi:hypothetical protein